MVLNDIADDRKPEPGAFPVLAAGGIGLVKPVPDLLDVLRLDADAVVLDGGEDLPARNVRRNVDRYIVSGELDRVVDQVVDDLLNAGPVRVDRLRRIFKLHLEGHVLFPGAPLKRRQHLADEVVQVEFGAVQNDAVFQLRHVEQFVRHRGQPVGLPDDNVQVFSLHFRRDRAVLHGDHIAADRGQRRAEIMGDVGDETALALIGGLQLAGHFV